MKDGPGSRTKCWRSSLFDIGNVKIRLPTPEDLIITKVVAHRPKDLADIQAIAMSHPGLDKGRIRFWVEQFGKALELPDLWKEVSELIWAAPNEGEERGAK